MAKNLLSTMSDQKLSVCLADVASAINKQKKGKCSGPDGIHNEAYMCVTVCHNSPLIN